MQSSSPPCPLSPLSHPLFLSSLGENFVSNPLLNALAALANEENQQTLQINKTRREQPNGKIKRKQKRQYQMKPYERTSAKTKNDEDEAFDSSSTAFFLQQWKLSDDSKSIHGTS